MHYSSIKSSPPPLLLPSKQTLIPFSLSFPSSLSPPLFSPPLLTSPQNQSVHFSFSPPHMANSGSGMAVDGSCKAKFMELKTKRSYRFVVFKIDEKEMKISVDSVGLPDENYDDFTACLPPNECRYAVYDFDFVTSENCNKSKIFFIAWSPDTSKVRSKMLYASSKDRFKRELDGIQVELQATEPSEMSLEIVRGRAL